MLINCFRWFIKLIKGMDCIMDDEYVYTYTTAAVSNIVKTQYCSR
jgi:hypothetical protein